MSRSQPTLTNPAGRFFEWSGSLGTLSFYDKEKQEKIGVPLPFTFLPLDELATIVGYSKRDESGFWSNEVRNITKDRLTVRTKKGIAQDGVYSELADVRSKGAKYAKSIYMAYKTRDGWQIGNLKAHGSALSAWIEFSKTCNPENGKVTIERGEVQDAPTGQFYPPKFIYDTCDKDEFTIAVNLDKELQIYLEQYLVRPRITDVEDEIVNGTPDEVTTDNINTSVESRSAQAPQSGLEKARAVASSLKHDERDEANDLRTLMENQPPEEEVDMSDIPF